MLSERSRLTGLVLPISCWTLMGAACVVRLSVLARERGWGIMAGGPVEGAAVGSRNFK